jgi:hypothetical protein
MRSFTQTLKAGLSGFTIVAFCVIGLVSFTQKNQPYKSNLDGRMLAQFERPTAQTFLDGSWMKSTENYVDDRIFARTALLQLHEVVASNGLQSREVAGVWIDPRTSMMFDKMPVLADPAHLDSALSDLKATTAAAEVPLLMAYVPKKQEVFADLLPQHWTNSYLDDKPAVLEAFSRTGDVIDLTDVVGAPLTRDKNWFLTDHHWSGAGAIAASNAVRLKLTQMGLPAPQPLPELSQITKYKPFIGSIGRRLTSSGVPQADDFSIAWTPEEQLTHCMNKSVKATTCNQPIFYNKIGNSKDPYANRYATFMNGDNAIDDLRGTGTGTYIVLKDSFGDSFVPYLALGAERIVAIDERHYTKSNLSQLIQQVKPDGVIMLHNQLSLSLLTPEQLAIWK